MPIPKTAHAAIFPQPAAAGPYTLRPPTLLHLAALDRLGCAVGRRIGADAAAASGFVLTRTQDELEAAMALPREQFCAECSRWAARQPAAGLPDLRDAVTRAVNAAFETAVPGAADPTPGQPPSSAGPSKSRRR